MNVTTSRWKIASVLLVAILVVTACGRGNKSRNVETPAPTSTESAAPDTATPAPTEIEQPAATEASEEAASSDEVETPQSEPAVAAGAQEAYPAPAETASPAAAEAAEGAYPPPPTEVESASTEPEAYPAPVTPTDVPSSIAIVPFVLEKPIAAGASVLSGTGPANVPIAAINITFMGELLGETVIGDDGTFEITVPPLEKNTWVGIAVNDLTGTGLTFDDFRANGFRGEGAEQVPQVGFVFDSVMVGE